MAKPINAAHTACTAVGGWARRRGCAGTSLWGLGVTGTRCDGMSWLPEPAGPCPAAGIRQGLTSGSPA